MDVLNRAFNVLMAGMLKATEIVPYTAPAKPVYVDKTEFRTDYPFVFVSGFWSWGQYKKGYGTLPYWGFFTGENYVKSMNASGIKAVASDVSPMGSAWDRACELYAQLTGTVVDYGRAHSEKFNHPRYGEDYSGRGLLEKWDAENKINIICHSFGGPTSALFASLLDTGSEEERKATSDGTLSPLFEGGKGNWLHSITGIAGAYNGTSLIVGSQAIADTVTYLQKNYFPLHKFDPMCRLVEKIAEGFEKLTEGGTPDPDTGLYDMVPDNSAELNKNIHAVKDVYYFTVPCCTTKDAPKKHAQAADMRITDWFFAGIAELMGMTDLVTPGGLKLDKDWQPNDGLVNTISEYGPMREEKVFLSTVPCPAAGNDFAKGKYHVFATYKGSHNSMSGGTVRPNKAAKNYLFELVKFIDLLEK